MACWREEGEIHECQPHPGPKGRWVPILQTLGRQRQPAHASQHVGTLQPFHMPSLVLSSRETLDLETTDLH